MKRILLLCLALIAAQNTRANSIARNVPSLIPHSALRTPHSFPVSAYCHCAKCCGRANQPAADGHMPIAGVTIAGPRNIPLGTRVYIQGLGVRVVTDRLAHRFDNRFDIFMPDHQTAQHFGLQKLTITILK